MRIFLLGLAILAYINASAQNDAKKVKYNISFNDKSDTIHRSTKKENLWTAEIISSNTDLDAFKDHKVDIVIDQQSNLPSDHYEIVSTIKGTALKDLKSTNAIRIVVKKQDHTFKQVEPLKLVLKIGIKRSEGDKDINDAPENNDGKVSQIVLVIMPEEPVLYTYKYLGYLGTNFDLVDGVQAKNLFFATNIFIPETNRWGINMSIYGNRSMTKTDTARNVSYTSRIVSLNGDSVAYYRDTATKLINRVSDNIGANFIPLIPLKFMNDGDLKLYYAPQFEFVWRRTNIENVYVNSATSKIDSMPSRFPRNVAFPIITPTNSKINLNVYDVYLGLLGLLLRYENEDISIRLNASVGFSFNYMPLGATSSGTNGNVIEVNPTYQRQEKKFFFGRLWITEPTTGLTLGAEMSNYFGTRMVKETKVSNAQPYYNVTLSKAFNLKNLAAFVKPLSNR